MAFTLQLSAKKAQRKERPTAEIITQFNNCEYYFKMQTNSTITNEHKMTLRYIYNQDTLLEKNQLCKNSWHFTTQWYHIHGPTSYTSNGSRTYRCECVLQDKHKLSTGFSECGNCGDHSACTVCETCSGACQNYLFPYPVDNHTTAKLICCLKKSQRYKP
jgi:hypothetical protein